MIEHSENKNFLSSVLFTAHSMNHGCSEDLLNKT